MTRNGIVAGALLLFCGCGAADTGNRAQVSDPAGAAATGFGGQSVGAMIGAGRAGVGGTGSTLMPAMTVGGSGLPGGSAGTMSHANVAGMTAVAMAGRGTGTAGMPGGAAGKPAGAPQPNLMTMG